MADENILRAYLDKKQKEEDAARLQQLSVPEQMESERREDWNNSNPLERFLSPVPKYMEEEYPSGEYLPNLKRYFNTAPVYKKGNKLEE